LGRTFLAPAKVNLFLKVLWKRDDGYHEIMSLVDIISIFDLIRITFTDENEIVVKRISGEMPEGKENIIYRAVKLLKDKYGIKKGVTVEVKKRIPLGAGLGGASSDAATVIRALTEIWALRVPDSELMEIGKNLGADVPLFLHGNPCVIRGIGEKIEPINLPSIWYVVIYPGVEISTREVYGHLKIVLTKRENDIKLSCNFNSLDEIVSALENDLEETAASICPQIKRLKEMLILHGAKGALMSGSGSSVFGCFESKEKAERAAKNLLSYGRVFVARSIGRHSWK